MVPAKQTNPTPSTHLTYLNSPDSNNFPILFYPNFHNFSCVNTGIVMRDHMEKTYNHRKQATSKPWAAHEFVQGRQAI